MSTENECIFCKIANKQIETELVAEGETWVAFKDLHPQAPVHLLMIPKKHIGSLDALKPEDAQVIAQMMLAVPELARQYELENGYRLVANTGKDGAQTVFHLHFHILGKRHMGWPPG